MQTSLKVNNGLGGLACHSGTLAAYRGTLQGLVDAWQALLPPSYVQITNYSSKSNIRKKEKPDAEAQIISEIFTESEKTKPQT